MITIKRIYEAASPEDGYRVLVDRLWPRGMTREKANIDAWFKEAGPSNSLRNWYGHDPQKWEGFKTNYKAELKKKEALLDDLKTLEQQHEKVSLLYGAKDTAMNQAVVLKEVLDNRKHTSA